MPKRLKESTEEFIIRDGKPSRSRNVQTARRTKMTIAITPELRKRLRIEAAERDCDMSDLIAKALEKHLPPQRPTRRR